MQSMHTFVVNADFFKYRPIGSDIGGRLEVFGRDRSWSCRGLALQRALIGRGDGLARWVHGGDRRAFHVVRGRDAQGRYPRRILQLLVIQLHVARRQLGWIRLRGCG